MLDQQDFIGVGQGEDCGRPDIAAAGDIFPSATLLCGDIFALPADFLRRIMVRCVNGSDLYQAVGQFVHIVVCAREVFGQHSTHVADTGREPFGDLALLNFH